MDTPAPALRHHLESRGLRLTDPTARAYRLVETLEPHAGTDPAPNVAAVAAIVSTVAEYEHGSADWPTDPGVYCMVAEDLALCILLGNVQE